MIRWIVLIAVACLSGFIGSSLSRVHAQSGQVVFLGAAAGTTLAANCPATPTTPSICVVGSAVYIWQSSTTGWFAPQPPAAGSSISSIQLCNLAGANCGTAQTGPNVVLKVPQSVAVTVGNPTVTATQGAVSATLQ